MKLALSLGPSLTKTSVLESFDEYSARENCFIENTQMSADHDNPGHPAAIR
jgi:hypothetical protein